MISNKKILFLSFLSLSSLTIQDSLADDFSWTDYRKTLPSSVVENDERSNSEMTKDYIKDTKGVNVERRTLDEIVQEQKTKNLTVSFLIRNTQEYGGGDTAYIPGITTSTASAEETSAYGVSITARFDLISIGKKFNNTYAEIDVWQDNIWIVIAKRIQGEDRIGLFSDIGAGLMFQTKETVRETDLYFYGYYRLGYNFENWNIKMGINIPSDVSDKGFIESTVGMASIGMRF